jgi:hypothetical protein
LRTIEGSTLVRDTFVDFDHSLNAAVAKLRQALDDSAENPRFIAISARRYRFVAPLNLLLGLNRTGATAGPSVNYTTPATALTIGAAVIAATLCALVFRTMRSKTHREEQISQLTSKAGLTIDPAVSPDGNLLACASDSGW